MVYIAKFQFSGNNSYLRAITMTCAHAEKFIEDFHLRSHHCIVKLPSAKSNNFSYIQAPCRSSWEVSLYNSIQDSCQTKWDSVDES